MPQYSILHSLVLSFYSPTWYRYAAREWRTVRAGLHLVLLLALSWGVTLAKIHQDLKAFAADEGRQIAAQVPPLTFSHGTVATPERRRYTIIDPETRESLAVIDTSASDPPPDVGEVRVVLTRDRLVVRRSALESRVFEVEKLAQIAGIDDGTLTPEQLATGLDAVAAWLPTALFPFLLAGSYIYRLVQALLYALVARIFGNLLRVPLAFDAAFRLAIVAITPAIALETVAELAAQPLPAVLYLLVAVGYLFTAVQANGEPAAAGPSKATET